MLSCARSPQAPLQTYGRGETAMQPHAFAQPRFGKVLVASGHMTDAHDRVEKGRGERFPERKSEAVRDMIAAQLDEWGAGRGDLAICGGARGADIIFAELCAE